jgi:hypothetical protein
VELQAKWSILRAIARIACCRFIKLPKLIQLIKTLKSVVDFLFEAASAAPDQKVPLVKFYAWSRGRLNDANDDKKLMEGYGNSSEHSIESTVFFSIAIWVLKNDQKLSRNMYTKTGKTLMLAQADFRISMLRFSELPTVYEMLKPATLIISFLPKNAVLCTDTHISLIFSWYTLYKTLDDLPLLKQLAKELHLYLPRSVVFDLTNKQNSSSLSSRRN